MPADPELVTDGRAAVTEDRLGPTILEEGCGKVLRLQLGIRDENAKKLMEKNNIDYVENKCTKMEYQKFFLGKRQAFPALSN